MCYPCKCCGKCKPKIAMGLCPLCRTQNDADARTCSGCGFSFPPKPGAPGGLDCDVGVRPSAQAKPPHGSI